MQLKEEEEAKQQLRQQQQMQQQQQQQQQHQQQQRLDTVRREIETMERALKERWAKAAGTLQSARRFALFRRRVEARELRNRPRNLRRAHWAGVRGRSAVLLVRGKSSERLARCIPWDRRRLAAEEGTFAVARVFHEWSLLRGGLGRWVRYMAEEAEGGGRGRKEAE